MTATTPPFAATLTVGSRIDNGATVLRSELTAEKDNGKAGEYVVLALHRDEFVTWNVAAFAATGVTEAYWGHYFGADLPAALADFDKRVAR